MGKTKVSLELEEFVAQAIASELLRQTIKEAVVAYIGIYEKGNLDASLRRVWRYCQGELVEGNPNILERAMGDDRTIWPPLTFIFTIEDEKSGQAIIDIQTYYDRGISEMSRGGYAQKWEMGKQSDEWTVIKKEIYRFWD